MTAKKSALFERATQHYANISSTPKKMTIPEWRLDEDAEDPEVFFTPMTLADKAKIRKFAKDDAELAAEIVILKCQDSDGNAVFTRADKQEIMRKMDQAVIERIASAILGESDGAVLEEYEKN